MNQRDFEVISDRLDNLCKQIVKKKRPEYIEGSEDVLANFYFISREMNLTPYQVLFVYLRKHLSSITQFCKGVDTKSEPIEERIADSINFLRLLYALIEDEKANSLPPLVTGTIKSCDHYDCNQ